MVLSERALLLELKAFALTQEPDCSLLRIYWYDGLVRLRETAEQCRLAESPNVKLRMGTVNSAGDQKGVDSLMVTDLVDLARAAALASAVVVSGDEDVRIGVEIAQRYGVRVHLLGIVPGRRSQSRQLLREADTTTEWDAATVARFLSVPAVLAGTGSSLRLPIPAGPPLSAPAVSTSPSELNLDPATAAVLHQAVEVVASSIRGSDVAGIIAGWDGKAGLDHAIDGRLLAQARNSLGRDLALHERRAARPIFVEHLRTFVPPPDTR